VDAERARLRQAMRGEQSVHERLQPVSLIDDNLRVLRELRARQLPLQQLRGATDASERILDFMCEIADQLAVGQALIQQPLFAIEFQTLIYRPELEQQRTLIGLFDRGGTAGEVQGSMRANRKLKIMLGVAARVGARILDRRQQAPSARKQFSDGAPLQLAGTELE